MKKETKPCSFEGCNCLYIQNRTKWLCQYHNFQRLHEGKSKFQVSKEKHKKIKPSKKRKSVLEADREFYKLCFNTKPQICEECSCYLPNEFETETGQIIYIARYSHILSKGAWNKYRHELWNINILCVFCHTKWENGLRKEMNIYEYNKELVFKNTGLDLLK